MYAKWRSDWAASAEYNRKALDLTPADAREGEPAAWNLGIAATALGDWATAREAWTAFGIPLPPAEQPGDIIVADFGAAPVRLNAVPRFVGQEQAPGDTEVVWGVRLCPARIQIRNVPTPESGHRAGDIVLHDGDPVGFRLLEGQEVGVFNELVVLERSPLPTLLAEVDASDPQAVEDLYDLITQDPAYAAEDWGKDLRILCRACSEGPAVPGHDHSTDEGWVAERRVGISADPQQARRLLGEWAAQGAGRAVRGLEVVLD